MWTWWPRLRSIVAATSWFTALSSARRIRKLRRASSIVGPVVVHHEDTLAGEHHRSAGRQRRQLGLDRERDREAELAALTGDARDREIAPHLPDDAPRDREAEPGSPVAPGGGDIRLTELF